MGAIRLGAGCAGRAPLLHGPDRVALFREKKDQICPTPAPRAEGGHSIAMGTGTFHGEERSPVPEGPGPLTRRRPPSHGVKASPSSAAAILPAGRTPLPTGGGAPHTRKYRSPSPAGGPLPTGRPTPTPVEEAFSLRGRAQHDLAPASSRGRSSAACCGGGAELPTWVKAERPLAIANREGSFSAPGAGRTHDLRFRKPLLYPLSYGGSRSERGTPSSALRPRAHHRGSRRRRGRLLWGTSHLAASK